MEGGSSANQPSSNDETPAAPGPSGLPKTQDFTFKWDVPTQRHPDFYFEDGSLVIGAKSGVGLTLFRVHRMFLERDSPKLKDRIRRLRDEQGKTDDKPLRLEEVNSSQLADLLWMFYNSTYDFTPSAAATERWLNILGAAHVFEMKTIRQIAIDALGNHKLEPTRKLGVCRQFNIDKAWAMDALTQLVSRSATLTLAEGNTFGMELVLIIMNAREKVATKKMQQPRPDWNCPYCGRRNNAGTVYCLCPNRYEHKGTTSTGIDKAAVEDIVKDSIKTFST